MTAKFERVGEQDFPRAPELRCDVYEWALPNPKQFGNFKIHFLCPDQANYPRRFYVDGVLARWLEESREDNFLERACSHGCKILHKLEHHSQQERDYYRLMLAIFPHRNRGHFGVGRAFKSDLDFIGIDFSTRCAESLVPGLNGETTISDKDTRQSVAHRLIEELTHGKDVKGSHAIVEELQNLIEGPRPAPSELNKSIFKVSVATRPGDSWLDEHMLDGVYRCSAKIVDRTFACVRQAMIYGPTDFSECNETIADEDLYSHFIRRLSKSLNDRKHRDFDTWLVNEREHGFVRLLPRNSELTSHERDEEKQRGKRIWCLLLWQSHLAMARAYGVLMWTAWLHLCMDEDIRVDVTERMLFRQMHLPQLYLATLPLAFLERPQLAWILKPLLERWHAENFRPDSYDQLTELLGLFGQLVRNRRQADRECAQLRRMQADPSVNDPTSDQDKFSGPRQTYPCPTCKEKTQLVGARGADDTTVTFEVYCKHCDKSVLVKAIREELSQWESQDAQDKEPPV